jgi:hypothetical protein
VRIRRFSPRQIVVAAGLASAGAVAPATRAAPTAAAPAASTPVLRSSLSQIAARLAADIGPTLKGAVVFAAPLRSDEPAPRGAELTGKLVALVAGAMGGGTSPSSEQVPLATAQTLARNAKWVVYLQPEVERGQLQVGADAYRATHNLWERARQPSTAPAAHSFASGRIDGEVRSYLAPVPLVEFRVDKVAIDDRDVVAVACGDVVEQGALEIVTLSRRRVAVGRAKGGRFVARKEAALWELSGIAPSPLREPLGGVAIVSTRGSLGGYIDLGLTDRAHGSRLDVDLRPLATVDGVPFATPDGDACTSFRGSTLDAGIDRCKDVDAPVDPSGFDAPLDAAATASYVAGDGTVRVIAATRDPRTAELRARADGKTATLAHCGAQIALSDLDEDGSPEIISTLDILPKAASGGENADALVITTWQSDGALRERARIPVPRGVRAVAACPPDGGGKASLIVATQGELWIVR